MAPTDKVQNYMLHFWSSKQGWRLMIMKHSREKMLWQIRYGLEMS